MRRAALAGAVLIALFAGGAQAADELALHVVSQTNSTITLGWTPQPGYGYLFSVNGSLVSRTNDPARASVKFSKVTNGTYEVAVIVKGATGTYPPPAPAPQCSDSVDNDGDGLVDFPADPGCTSATDNDETNVAPPPKPACSDGADNDGDGKIDYPADPGCSSVSDTDETDPVQPPGNVFVAPNGNDSNACTQAAPCRTLLRGYAAANSGNTISVAVGSYGGGIWTGTKTVTLQAVGTVNVSSTIEIRSLSNVTFAGNWVSTVPGESDWSLRVNGNSNNLTFNSFSGSHFDLSGCGSHFLFKGGSWGGYTGRPWAGDTSIGGDQLAPECGDGLIRDVVIDGVRFHDVQYGPSSTWGGAHPDCIQVGGAVDGLIIRNSVIERCGNTFIGTFLDFGDMRNFTVENTLFRDIADSGAAVQIGNKPAWVCQGITFRYNTFESGSVPPLINCPTDPNGQVYGNIFSSKASCGQAVWSYNIWGAGPLCGTNSYISTDPGFVSATDFHLAAGAFAIGKGDPGRFPPTDFEGTPRTSVPDAGYDER